MKKIIYKYDEYKEALNEGLWDDTKNKISDIKNIALDKITSAVDTLVTITKKITSGWKSGTNVVEVFTGNITSELMRVFGRTKYGQTGTLSEAYLNNVENIEIVEISEDALNEAFYYDINDPKLKDSSLLVGNKHSEDSKLVSLEYNEKSLTGIPNIDGTTLINYIKTAYDDLLEFNDNGWGRTLPMFIFGAPGIGKTQIVGQAAKSLGINMVTMSLQFMNTEDLTGLPTPSKTKLSDSDKDRIKKAYGEEMSDEDFLPFEIATSYAAPDILNKIRNRENLDKGGILFLDEVNSADEYTLAKSINFILTGTINSYKLPSNWMIVMAGNRHLDRQGKLAKFEDDTALIQRIDWYNFIPNRYDWIQWAESVNEKAKNDPKMIAKYPEELRVAVPPEIISFIASDEGAKAFYDVNVKQGGLSPRSWDIIGKLLLLHCNRNGLTSITQIPKKDMFAKMAGKLPSSKTLVSFIDYISIGSFIDDRMILDIMENYEKDPSRYAPIPKIVKDPDNGGRVNLAMWNGLINTIISVWNSEITDDLLLSLDGVRKGMKYQYNILSYLKSYTKLSSGVTGLPADSLPMVINRFDFTNRINKLPSLVFNKGVEFKDDVGVTGDEKIQDAFLTSTVFKNGISSPELLGEIGLDENYFSQFNSIGKGNKFANIVAQSIYLRDFVYPKAKQIDPTFSFLGLKGEKDSILPSKAWKVTPGEKPFACPSHIWLYSMENVDLESGVLNIISDEDYPKFKYKKDDVMLSINVIDLIQKETADPKNVLNVVGGIQEAFEKIYDKFVKIPSLTIYKQTKSNNSATKNGIKHTKIVEVIKEDPTVKKYRDATIKEFGDLDATISRSFEI